MLSPNFLPGPCRERNGKATYPGRFQCFFAIAVPEALIPLAVLKHPRGSVSGVAGGGSLLAPRRAGAAQPGRQPFRPPQPLVQGRHGLGHVLAVVA